MPARNAIGTQPDDLAAGKIHVDHATYRPSLVEVMRSLRRSDVQEVEKTVMQSSEPESNRLSVKPTAFHATTKPSRQPITGPSSSG